MKQSRTLMLVGMLTCCLVRMCLADTMPSATEMLAARFAKVESGKDGLTLTVKEGGPRLVYSVGEMPPKIAEPGEEIVVPYGTAFTAFERHETMNFVPVKGRKAFIMKRKADQRSVGKGVKEEESVLVASEQTDEVAPKEDEVVKGLKVLSISDLEKVKSGEIR